RFAGNDGTDIRQGISVDQLAALINLGMRGHRKPRRQPEQKYATPNCVHTITYHSASLRAMVGTGSYCADETACATSLSSHWLWRAGFSLRRRQRQRQGRLKRWP